MRPPMTTVFPAPGARNPFRKEKRVTDLVTARAARRQVPENADGHKGKAGGRPRRAMACLPSEY